MRSQFDPRWLWRHRRVKTKCFWCLMNQDKYFRLENVNTPRILVKSIIDYDVVQKISLVLHVQVPPSSLHETHLLAVTPASVWPFTSETLPGHVRRFGLQRALLHLRGVDHGSREGRGQPAAVVSAVHQDQPGHRQAVCERRLQREGQPDGERGEEDSASGLWGTH